MRPIIESIKRREAIAGCLFVIPALAIITIFWIIPSIGSIFFSFFKYDGINLKFIGLYNFIKFIFRDPSGLHSLKVTLYYSLGTLPPCLFLGLAIALIVNEKWFRGKKIITGIYFLPFALSYSVVALLWRWLLDPIGGVVNYTLEIIGLPPQSWLSEPRLALFSLFFVVNWRNLGFFVIIYLTALQGISNIYLEAADLDGATKWQKIRFIIWPLLLPTTIFLTILSIIDAFKVFDVVYVLTFGGPENATKMIAFYVWETGFLRLWMGYSSGIATVLLIIMLVLTFIQWKYYTRKMVYF